MDTLDRTTTSMAFRRGRPSRCYLSDEAYFYGFVMWRLGYRQAKGNFFVRHIRTTWKHCASGAGDLDLTLWHLPSEKRLGIRRVPVMARGTDGCRAPIGTKYSRALGYCCQTTSRLFKLTRDRREKSRFRRSRIHSLCCLSYQFERRTIGSSRWGFEGPVFKIQRCPATIFRRRRRIRIRGVPAFGNSRLLGYASK